MEEGMHIVENRVASFIDAKFTWPHPDTFGVAPLNLAEAGFYFDPHLSGDDSCVCFLCQKSLGGWEAEDNPNTEHISHAPYCAWAKLLCSRIFVTGSEIPLENFDEDSYLPTSSFMEAARAATFQELWPHENKKGWLCNVKKMAKAGFHYNPTPDSDDTACCIYCNTTLDGWEPRDSPVKEHRKRAPTCPFFSKDLKNTIKKMDTVVEKKPTKDIVAETIEPETEESSSDSRKVKPRESSSSESSQVQAKPKNQRGSRKKKEAPEISATAVAEPEQSEELPPVMPERRVRGGRKRKVDMNVEEIPIVSKSIHQEGDETETVIPQVDMSKEEVDQESEPKQKKTKNQEHYDTENPDSGIQETSILNPSPTELISPKSATKHHTAGEEASDSMELEKQVQEKHGSDEPLYEMTLSAPTTNISSLEAPVDRSDEQAKCLTSNNSLQPSPEATKKVEEILFDGILSEEELSMTVEQFMRSLIDKQVKKLQLESEEKIAQFMQEADKIKNMIGTMD